MKTIITLGGLCCCLFNILPMNAQTGFCDPNTGLCTPAPLVKEKNLSISYRDDVEIIYVGDPMCSWCWGISPQLNQLQRKATQESIPYRIVVGGLRPGGGDPWNEQFINFLRHHWEEVSARSGQPFGYQLFERNHFNYDTEPSCRAVVAARQMNPSVEQRFFELTQHYFYVQNEDPKEVSFYKPICKELHLDFEAFTKLFQSEAIKKATQKDFQLNRSWGVRGYPTILVRHGAQMYVIGRGYTTYDQLWSAVEQVLEEAEAEGMRNE
jgi:putative protein-disulfide isomerase